MDTQHQMTDNSAYGYLPQPPPLPKRNAPGNVLFGIGRGLAGKFFADYKGWLKRACFHQLAMLLGKLLHSNSLVISTVLNWK